MDGKDLLRAALAKLADEVIHMPRSDKDRRAVLSGMTEMAEHLVTVVFPGTYGSTPEEAGAYVAEEIAERMAAQA